VLRYRSVYVCFCSPVSVSIRIKGQDMTIPAGQEQSKETEDLDPRTYTKRTIDGVTIISPAPSPDIVKQLLFRSSDEAGIGWTPTTVVHVPAGLLHNAADDITRLTAEVERLQAAETDAAIALAALNGGEDLQRVMRENERLRAVLDLYREAVRIDVTMEGPRFMGANSSALKRAWDADCAALAQETDR